MRTLHFQINIHAPKSEVYRNMLGLDQKSTYEAWTSAFNPTSTYEGSWEKGTRIRFLGTGDDGEPGGMVSEVIEHIPEQFISLQHKAVLKGGQEITDGPEVETWAGGLENYSFSGDEQSSMVTVTTDTPKEYEDYFKESWPKALEALKVLCESN